MAGVIVAFPNITHTCDYTARVRTIADCGIVLPPPANLTVVQKEVDEQAKLTASFKATVEKMTFKLALNMVRGEKPQVLMTSDVCVMTAKSDTNTLAGDKLNGCVDAKFELPSSFGSETTNEDVNMVFSSSNRNLYGAAPGYLTGISGTVSLKFTVADSGDAVEVKDLTQPITIVLPNTGPIRPNHTVKCRWWDIPQDAWSLAGCTVNVEKSTPNQTACDCSHNN